jgi:hypothetical protein
MRLSLTRCPFSAMYSTAACGGCCGSSAFRTWHRRAALKPEKEDLKFGFTSSLTWPDRDRHEPNSSRMRPCRSAELQAN